MKSGPTCSVIPVWITVILVLTDVCSANESNIAAQHTPTGPHPIAKFITDAWNYLFPEIRIGLNSPACENHSLRCEKCVGRNKPQFMLFSPSTDVMETFTSDSSKDSKTVGRKLPCKSMEMQRNAKNIGCVLPPPLENGKFYPSARRCRPEDSAPACRMVPGTPVPHHWVLFFYCNAGFTLNTTKPLSVCLNGHWTPALPVCEDHKAITIEGLDLKDIQCGPLLVNKVGESECSSNGQCPDNRTCIVGKCADSCDGLCGPNTDCEVSYHRPLCACRNGYVGNPFKGCIKGEPISMKLLLTQSTQVSVLDVTLQKIVSILHYTDQNPKENSPSVAYHYEKKYVFYSGPTQIFRDEVAGPRLTRTGRTEAVVGSGVDANAKLAVDWVHDKLYFMSYTDETLEVSDLDGNNRATLLSSELHFNWNLNNIAVDPYAGYLFLVSNDSIHRMNLDGSNFTRLRLAGEKKRGVYVLTLQPQKRKIFYSSWDLEEDTPFITTCDYDGRNGKDIPIGDRWSEIHAVDVFRDTLFFGHYRRGESDQVWSVDLTSPSPTPVMIQTVEKAILGLKVYHPDVQKESR